MKRLLFAGAGPVGLEDDLRNLALIGPAGGDAFGAARTAAMQEHHVRVLGAGLVEHLPDALVIIAIAAPGEGDARAGRGAHFGVGTKIAPRLVWVAFGSSRWCSSDIGYLQVARICTQSVSGTGRYPRRMGSA